MLTQIEDVINQIEMQLQEEKAADALVLERENKERKRRGEAALRSLLGSLAEALMGMVYAHDCEPYKNGRVVALEWRISDDEQKLAPMIYRWTIGEDGDQERFTVYVDNGGRGTTWHKATENDIPQILYQARNDYAAWRKKIEAIQENEHRVNEIARRRKIADLTWDANWGAHRSEEEISKQYATLAALDSERAEERLSFYRHAVAEKSRCDERREQKRAALAAEREEYDRQMIVYREQCEAWVAAETARLWSPWTLWKVRYAPFDVSLIHRADDVEYGPDLIQTVYTLDDPKIIAQQRAIVSLKKINEDGTVIEHFFIACFLDAEPIHYNQPTTSYHRTYWAGNDYMVNVPPFVRASPVPAPEMPVYPQGEQSDEAIPF